MKALLSSILLLLVSAGPRVSAPPASEKVAGEYVEARTASVYAGACHFNGEVVTTGRDAIMAWRFTSGSWNGVDLSGRLAMAALSSDENLGQEKAARKVEFVVDTDATDA